MCHHRGEGRKKGLGILGTLQNSASATFNWKDTNGSSTEASLSADGRLCFVDVIDDGRSVLTRLTLYQGPSLPGDLLIEVPHRSVVRYKVLPSRAGRRTR